MYHLFVLVLLLSFGFSPAVRAEEAKKPTLDDVFAAIRTLQSAPALQATPAQPQSKVQPIAAVQPVYAPQPYMPPVYPPYPYYYPPQPPQPQAALPAVETQFVCVGPEEAEAKEEEKPKIEPLSDELKGAIKQRVASCWIPAYINHAPAIDMTFSFKEDGSIADAKLSGDQMEKYKKDMLFKSLVNSLRRAAFNPRCAPGQGLPEDKYESWKEVALTFDVKDAPR